MRALHGSDEEWCAAWARTSAQTAGGHEGTGPIAPSVQAVTGGQRLAAAGWIDGNRQRWQDIHTFQHVTKCVIKAF